MRRIVFLSLLFTAAVLSGCEGSRQQRQIKNIEAFAHTYGLVRWFYPADETQRIDWNKFAVYGISQVADCRSSKELKQKLEEIFLPVASGIRFSNTPEYDFSNSITPCDTTGMSVISWQHYGVDLGLWSNRYMSKRTHRPLQTHNTSKLAFEGLLPATSGMNAEVTISADIKNDTPEGLKIFFRAAINNGPADYICFCVADSTLKPVVNSGAWQTYTQTVNIKPEHVNSLIRCGIYTEGEGQVSIRNISIRSSAGKNIAADFSSFWCSAAYDYTWHNEQCDISTKTKLFDDQNHFGDVTTSELASGIYVHVPLALYGTPTATYPDGDNDKLARLQKEMDAAKYSDRDRMAADIIVTWNVFNYFHPYLAEQHIAWDEELGKALGRTFEYDSYHLRPLKLMTACLNDAHININMPDISLRDTIKYLPFWVKKIQDELVVIHAVDPQFHAGDRIDAIDGTDAIANYRYFEDEVSGSPQHKAERAQQPWSQSFGERTTVAVSIKREGKNLNITTAPVEREVYIRTLKPALTGSKSRWIDENTLYLNLSNTNFNRIQDFLANRKKNQTVIMDARNGVPFQFIYIIPLISKMNGWPMRNGIIQIPNVIRPETPVITDTLTNKSAVPDKKNIFLTGPDYSHYEETLDCIRYAGLGYFIGTNTGGCNGAINMIQLPSGGEMWFTGTKVLSNLGKDSYYYATGIKPDLYVQESIDDITHGRDAALDQAINMNK